MLKCQESGLSGLDWARRAAIALIALSMALVYGASSARATCGDYVMVGDHHHAGHGHHPAPPSHQSRPGVPECHGPNCHRHVPLSPAPKPLGGEDGPQQWAVLSAANDMLSPRPASSLAETRISLCEGHFSPLERPPCSVA